MRATGRVMIVGADARASAKLALALTPRGFDVLIAISVAEMNAGLAQAAVDVVVLDLAAVGDDGLGLCRRLAAEPGPAVLVLGATADRVECILALELGADDYLAPPCGAKEVVARVTALVRGRRVGLGRRAPQEGDDYAFGGLRLQTIAHRLETPDGVSTPIPATEYRALKRLLDQPGEVVSRQALDEAIADGAGRLRMVALIISRLRRRLSWLGAAPALIVTVFDHGYRLDGDVVRLPSERQTTVDEAGLKRPSGQGHRDR